MKKFQMNFIVRVKNKMFWLAFIPAFIVFIQMVLGIFGISIDLSEKEDQLLKAVESLFALLTVMGVLNDPTTKGLSDSDKAMLYTEPKERD